MTPTSNPDPAGAVPANAEPGGRRIGVYVCHCGGNISDYVDVQQVIDEVSCADNVVVARAAMFTCSDATQQEIVADIGQQRLDGLVVASCSPKLHTETFREVARRGGLNPYQYTQCNIREQCSWAHADDRAGATTKATGLVRAGIARTALTTPLVPLRVDTVPAALVLGGGITGLRAAVGLADLGLAVYLVERTPHLGGRVGGFGTMFPHDRSGRQLVDGLIEQIRARDTITVFTGAELVGRSGTFGNYQAVIRVGGADSAETITVGVGAVLVATGFDTYQPAEGEFGTGSEGVLTLPEFKRLVDDTDGPLTHHGRPVRGVAYIYCVGSRQPRGAGNEYCSRFCCSAAVHASLQVTAMDPGIHQYHLIRDMRAYGVNELNYDRSRRAGSHYLNVADDAPPRVSGPGADGRLTVTVRDQLAGDLELELPVDLVVLVTGAVPRENGDLIRTLKLPVGRDGFLNEIHPKLRPVETVVDGVTICGACQSPRTSAESVTSGLAAVTQCSAVLKRGHADLDPLVAVVDPRACDGCGRCVGTCPYGAISLLAGNGAGGSPIGGSGDAGSGDAGAGGGVAVIDAAACKGCGGCAPECHTDAIDLRGCTDAQIRGMIDSLLEVAR
jgi:heterodisulfide reductase subunit A